MKKSIKLPEGTIVFELKTGKEYKVIKRSGLDHHMSPVTCDKVELVINQHVMSKYYKVK